MNICQIVPSLEEKYGGPSKSVLGVSRALAEIGNTVSLLATQPSVRTARREGDLRVEIFPRGNFEALCPSRALRLYLRTSGYDMVHHHSLWLRTLHYAHRDSASRGVPLVISPRGMMSKWAWTHHGWRKKVVRQVVHPGALEGATGWHATSAGEADEIRSHGFKQPVCVAPNGVSIPSPELQEANKAYWTKVCPDLCGRRVALFYSRFHRKKRLLELIDLWLSEDRGDWLLLIVGLSDDYTAQQLQKYIMRQSGAGKIHVFDGEGEPAPYDVASLFVLPSHGENFGLVIAESMAHGVPVVVTDSTPWTAINRFESGWCVAWEQYPSVLKQALTERSDSLAEKGTRARQYISETFSWLQAARTLRDFYSSLAT
jgi:glycosyltransferase involved in cell wall biosynthesis